MITWFKNNFKQMLIALTISIVLVFIFVIYLVYIGVPKTQARNDYNKGMLALEDGDEESAKEYFESALEHWDEKYIREELELLNIIDEILTYVETSDYSSLQLIQIDFIDNDRFINIDGYEIHYSPEESRKISPLKFEEYLLENGYKNIFEVTGSGLGNGNYRTVYQNNEMYCQFVIINTDHSSSIACGNLND